MSANAFYAHEEVEGGKEGGGGEKKAEKSGEVCVMQASIARVFSQRPRILSSGGGACAAGEKKKPANSSKACLAL